MVFSLKNIEISPAHFCNFAAWLMILQHFFATQTIFFVAAKLQKRAWSKNGRSLSSDIWRKTIFRKFKVDGLEIQEPVFLGYRKIISKTQISQKSAFSLP